jgi:hypothetical protein
MEFRTSIPRTLGLVGFVVLATLGSYAAARAASAPPVIHVAGWVGVALCIFVLVFPLSQLFRRGPTVVIDETGVLDLRLGVGPISWEDISSVSVARVSHQRLLILWLRNEERYRSRLPAWKAALSRMSERVGFAPFSINFAGLTPGVDEAYARLRTRVPEHTGV